MYNTLVYRFCLYPSLSDKQHIRHCIALGGELYPRPEMVDFILRPEIGVEKQILDVGQYSLSVPRTRLTICRLGCGSGIWWVLLHVNPDPCRLNFIQDYGYGH